MEAIKGFVLVIALYVAFQLITIIGGGIIDFAKLMMPGSGDPIEEVNKGLKDGADWFHEHSGRTDAQREAAYNAAGLYYNPKTGEYEEDPERFSRELDQKYRKPGTY